MYFFAYINQPAITLYIIVLLQYICQAVEFKQYSTMFLNTDGNRGQRSQVR